MLYRLWSPLRAALAALRARGVALPSALLWQLPLATALRAWRALAGALNARVLNPWLNAGRLARFQAGLPPAQGLRLVVIVMPQTLHFLLPCLALLHGRAPLLLLANGARAWERALLRRRLPDVPMFVLRTLPLSSLPHGDAVSLLLAGHPDDFALVDHDAYVFDPGLLARLRPAAGECLVSPFAQRSRRCGLVYPLTHVLGLNAAALRSLMQRHGVDARLYRRAPAAARPALARIGLGTDGHFKDYQRFHDTLHVLLALALDQGLRVRIEHAEGPPPVVHVGGTSIGSHHTKNLFALYVHLRFLELLGDPLLSARYAFITRPLRSAAQALARRPARDAAWQTLPVVEQLMQRLEAAGAGHGFRTLSTP